MVPGRRFVRARAVFHVHGSQLGYIYTYTQLLSHTPSSAFRHLPPRKDAVDQCLEFATELSGGVYTAMATALASQTAVVCPYQLQHPRKPRLLMQIKAATEEEEEEEKGG